MVYDKSGVVDFGIRLAVVGLPGAGKTTQGERIADMYDAAYVSTGDLCRDNLEYVTVTGETIGDYLSEGKLPPTDDVAALLERDVGAYPAGAGYIIDGFPRTATQVEMLDDTAPVDALLYLDVDVADAVERLQERGRADDTARQIANRIDEQAEELDGVLSAAYDADYLDVITVHDNALADSPETGIERMWDKIDADLRTYYDGLV